MENLEGEVWKPIIGYEGIYEISNMGRVKSFAKTWVCNRFGATRKKDDTILSTPIDSDGYRIVGLHRNGKQKSFKIYTLVWDHFGDKPRNGRKLLVDHIDNPTTNDRIDNLQLLTNRENVSKDRLFSGKKTSKYTGVHWDKNAKKWMSTIYINGKRNYLGLFESETAAMITYQRELLKI
jgi:hypothetical protein